MGEVAANVSEQLPTDGGTSVIPGVKDCEQGVLGFARPFAAEDCGNAEQRSGQFALPQGERGGKEYLLFQGGRAEKFAVLFGPGGERFDEEAGFTRGQVLPVGPGKLCGPGALEDDRNAAVGEGGGQLTGTGKSFGTEDGAIAILPTGVEGIAAFGGGPGIERKAVCQSSSSRVGWEWAMRPIR